MEFHTKFLSFWNASVYEANGRKSFLLILQKSN